jgi:hypothetical protein
LTHNAREPCIYIVGRSSDAGNSITAELKVINPAGEYIFIRPNVSLLENVDRVWWDIIAKESAINLLFLSARSLLTDTLKYRILC